MEEVRWLKTMLSTELEVRPPTSDKKEAKYLQGDCAKIYRDGDIIGYAEMRKVGSHTEISTVLVDNNFRGQGVGKELIGMAVKQIKNDKSNRTRKNPHPH